MLYLNYILYRLSPCLDADAKNMLICLSMIYRTPIRFQLAKLADHNCGEVTRVITPQ